MTFKNASTVKMMKKCSTRSETQEKVIRLGGGLESSDPTGPPGRWRRAPLWLDQGRCWEGPCPHNHGPFHRHAQIH